MSRVRYQFGSLQLIRNVWSLRYYEAGPNGKRHYRRVRIGSKTQFLTEAAALKAVDAWRLSINSSESPAGPGRFGAIVGRYIREELPERYSTRMSYLSLLKGRIRPKWDEIPVNEIKTLEIEHWLRSLTLAPKTKANIRNLMHVIFECARRWELTDRNPIELVRQSARRQRVPRRLTPTEFRSLLTHLSEPTRTMAVLAGCLGLRIGEVLGLQWRDVDLLNGTLSINRSVYQYHVGPAKTCYSETVLPLAPEIVGVLQIWLSQASYRSEGDWIFASDKGGLRDADKLRATVLQAAAAKAQIGKIGWHTLRHTFATALDGAGARMKVAQELMRHANIATTMDVYTGALERDKREVVGLVAQSLVGSVQ
jgi:integrase